MRKFKNKFFILFQLYYFLYIKLKKIKKLINLFIIKKLFEE